MTETHAPPRWLWIAPILFVILWATGFIVAKLSAGHVEPLTFLSIRFTLAGLLFVGIAMLRRESWPGSRLAIHAMVAGALLHGGYLGPVYWAVTNGMPAGVSALIVGLQPLLTAVLAAMIIGEAITAKHWVGLAIGLFGIALVVWPKLSLDGMSGITPLTTAVNIFGALSVSLGTVYQKRFATGLNLATGGIWQYAGATIVVFIWALAMEDFIFDGSFNAWFSLGWSVIVMSLGAITLLMLLIRHGNVASVAGLIYLVPAVSAFMAFVIFGETLSLVQLIGMAVCAAAVLLVTRPAPSPL